MAETYDAVVVGAGPAGSVAAMFLARAGKNVLLLDKAVFPREKICGDAQGRKAAGVMRELGIYEEYEKIPGQKIYGITLSSPNGTQVELDVESRDKPAPGYTHKRMVFDNFLFGCAERTVKTKILDVNELVVEDGCLKGVAGLNEKGEREELRAKIILAADGATSMVAARFGLDKNPREHLIVALRAYYKNVKGLTDRIEIHLIRELLPGYFWVFPLPDNEANVGLGMIVKDMNDKKTNLKEAMLKQISDNPLFRERFGGAELAGEIRGWNLPIASFHRKCYGNGFLLLGDAAGLIDPLSGEGVGNAMISGQVAGKFAAEALDAGNFSESFLQKYDELLWAVIGDEVKTNYKLQTLGKQYPELIDALLAKAAAEPEFRKKLEGMLPYTGGRKEMGSGDFVEFLKS